MSLLAESDNSSSEAGLFYSTSWGSGVMGGYNYSNEIDLVLVFRQEPLLLKVKDLEHQLNLNQLSRLLMHLDDII